MKPLINLMDAVAELLHVEPHHVRSVDLLIPQDAPATVKVLVVGTSNPDNVMPGPHHWNFYRDYELRPDRVHAMVQIQHWRSKL